MAIAGSFSVQVSSSENRFRLKPEDIRFTHGDINDRFTDGRTLERTFCELLYDEKSITDIEELIEVVIKDGKYWALNGNRRLFIFKKLAKLGMISEIDVQLLDLADPKIENRFKERMTSKTDGKTIVVRNKNHSDLDRRLDDIGREWSRKQNEKFDLIIKNAQLFSPTEDIDYPFAEYDDAYDKLSI